MITSKGFILIRLCLLISGTSISLTAWSASILKASIDEQSASQVQSVESQQRINQLSQKTTDIVHEYQQVSEQLNTLQIYNQQLAKLVNSQNKLISTKIQQLDSIEQTEQSIVPLMLRMIATLEQFIQLDMPFLQEQRQQRVSALKKLMDQADISSAQKYHQILEVFLLEMDYGRTIETWQGKHPDNSAAMVNFFRIGRIALVYQSLDGENAFYWSNKSAQYKTLSAEFHGALARGFRVARKQLAPEFITLPVSAPVPLLFSKTSSEGGIANE
jgi:hypothetical protein